MLQPVRPARRDDRRRRAALGHLCPSCRTMWALTAVQSQDGFVVVCRRCDYRRPVLVIPGQTAAGAGD